MRRRGMSGRITILIREPFAADTESSTIAASIRGARGELPAK